MSSLIDIDSQDLLLSRSSEDIEFIDFGRPLTYNDDNARLNFPPHSALGLTEPLGIDDANFDNTLWNRLQTFVRSWVGPTRNDALIGRRPHSYKSWLSGGLGSRRPRVSKLLYRLVVCYLLILFVSPYHKFVTLMASLTNSQRPHPLIRQYS